MTHIIKSWPQFFGPICEGTRTHELRRNDRDYSIGDTLILKEFEPQSHHYTGRECKAEITSMTSFAQPCAVSGEALNADFCILSIRLL
jgi:hypothetical protein